jgi:HEAT repeat protein
MTDNPYSLASTDALIDSFVRTARAARSLYTLEAIPKKTVERDALIQEMLMVSAELKRRAPIQELRPLFDHESNDVRGHAAWQFMDIDEEWAFATMDALNAGLSTAEMMALRARARKGPPRRPLLKDMSVDELAARYEDAGIRNYATQFMGRGAAFWNVKLSNKIVDEMGGIINELKSRNALTALLPLLDHANMTVRGRAAETCLSIAPERAVPILEAINENGGWFDKGNASWALYRWRDENKMPGKF